MNVVVQNLKAKEQPTRLSNRFSRICSTKTAYISDVYPDNSWVRIETPSSNLDDIFKVITNHAVTNDIYYMRSYGKYTTSIYEKEPQVTRSCSHIIGTKPSTSIDNLINSIDISNIDEEISRTELKLRILKAIKG